MKQSKSIIIDLAVMVVALAVTVVEFVAFVKWGKNMQPGDEMGFFLITTYFLFPVTTLIISGCLGYKNPLILIPFIPIMFLAQNYMPYILTGTFEWGMVSVLTFVPAVIGAVVGILIRIIVKPVKKKKKA